MAAAKGGHETRILLALLFCGRAGPAAAGFNLRNPRTFARFFWQLWHKWIIVRLHLQQLPEIDPIDLSLLYC